MVFNIQLVSCLSPVIVLINLFCFFLSIYSILLFLLLQCLNFHNKFCQFEAPPILSSSAIANIFLSTACLIFSSSPTAIFKFVFLFTANLILSSLVIANILSILSISCFLFFANCNIHKYLSMSINRFSFPPFPATTSIFRMNQVYLHHFLFTFLQ